MKRTYLLLYALLICTSFSFSTTPTEDTPHLKFYYSSRYPESVPLLGKPLSYWAVPNRCVIIAEDGQQYWYPITTCECSFSEPSQYFNYYGFYATGYFFPTADQVREIQNIKISKIFWVLYSLDLNGPTLDTDMTSIWNHQHSGLPTIPWTIVEDVEWLDQDQTVVNNWNPDKAYSMETDNSSIKYDEHTDLNVLFHIDGNIQISIACVEKGRENLLFKHIKLDFDDGTDMIIPLTSNITLKNTHKSKYIGCSAPILFSRLRDKYVTSISIETNSGEIQGDNSHLIDILNDKINLKVYPSLTNTIHYKVLSQMDMLKTVPNLLDNKSQLSILQDSSANTIETINEDKTTKQINRTTLFYRKDKVSKKYSICDQTGKEVIPPIFPKMGMISNIISLIYYVDECQKAGITQEDLMPLLEYENILVYYIKSTKEFGFINKDGKRIKLNYKDAIMQDNDKIVIVYQQDGWGSRKNWRLYNMEGEVLAKTQYRPIKLLSNGLIFIEDQFFYEDLEPIIPIDFPSEYEKFDNHPEYMTTADGIMYFNRCFITYPDGNLREVIVAIPEKK